MGSERRAAVGCALVAGAGVGLLSGITGVFTRAVCSSLGIARGAFSLVPAIAALLSAVLAPQTARLLTRRSVRKVVLTGAAACGAVPLLFSVCSRLWQFCAAAALNGLFLGRITMLALGSVLAPLEEPRRAKALGAATASAALFTAAATPAAQWALDRFGWRQAYRITGSAALLFLFAGAMLLPAAPLPPAPGRSGTGRARIGALFGAGALNLCNLALTNHAIPALGDLGAYRAAPLVAAAGTLLTIPMRLLAARAYPRLGTGRTLRLLCAGIGLAAFNALCLPQAWALACHPPLLAVAATANALPCAALACDAEGRQDNRLYARLTAASSIGGACGTPLAGFAFDAAGSYRPMWIACAVLAAAAAIALEFPEKAAKGTA